MLVPWQRVRANTMTEPRNNDRPNGWSSDSLWSSAGIAQQDFPPGLYVVATPLGNAADITLRALWVLRLVDCVAAEDTRNTAPLLARYGINARLLALHEHNEARAGAQILEHLAHGQRVAIVSDAGTPAICDPGALVVRAALAAGVRVIPVPGASSLTAALCAAGVRAGPIRFWGFVPARAAARQRQWTELGSEEVAVLFEVPHRVVATARELGSVLEPARRVVVLRELTKRFESIAATTAAELPALIEAAPPRGEYVLVIDAADARRTGSAQHPAAVDALTARWLSALRKELPASRAAAVAAKVSGLPRAVLYRALSAESEDD